MFAINLRASSGLILKLSDLLSYVLYENDETSVPYAYGD